MANIPQCYYFLHWGQCPLEELKWKLWVDLTGLNQTSSLRTDEIGWNIKKTRLILRETLKRCDFTLKLYKAIFNIQ